MKYYVSIENENGLVLDRVRIKIPDYVEVIKMTDLESGESIGRLEVNRKFESVNPACPYCFEIWATCKCMGPWDKANG